jgi:hypothetical protein
MSRSPCNRPLGRGSLALALTGVGLALVSSSASAAATMTIGQLGPSPPTTACNTGPDDLIQPTVVAGDGYVVPPDGALITSWSTNAGPGGGQVLEMKVFRKVTDPDIYKVVAHDGPRPLVPSLLNTFPVNLAVQPGDVLGLNDANASSANNYCAFTAPGEIFLHRNGDLADGDAGGFGSQPNNLRLNISATVALQPSNTFSLGKLKRNPRNGTATLTVDVPGPGTLSLTGKRVKTQRPAREATASRAVAAAGMVKLVIKARGKAKRKLNRSGKAKVTAIVTYTPTGEAPGVPNTHSEPVRLIKKQ